MDSCLLCELNLSQDNKIHETEFWRVDLPLDIKMPGLLFIRLKRHCEQLADLTVKESQDLGQLIKFASKKSQEIAKPRRVLAMSLGLKDPHLHFWIIPVREEDEENIKNIPFALRSIVSPYKL